MSFQENNTLRPNDGMCRRTKFYYHPSKCPRSWPNYNRNELLLKAFTKDPSHSRNSSKELETYPLPRNNEYPAPKLKGNPDSLNVILSEGARTALRTQPSRTKRNISFVASSSDDSLTEALLDYHRNPNTVPPHISESQVMRIGEYWRKRNEAFAFTCAKYCEKLSEQRLPPFSKCSKKRLKPRECSKTRDIPKRSTTNEAKSSVCGGYCLKYFRGEIPRNVSSSDTKVPEYAQEKRESEYAQEKRGSEYAQEKRESEYAQEKRESEYAQEKHGSEYAQEKRGSEYAQERRGPEYAKEKRESEYAQEKLETEDDRQDLDTWDQEIYVKPLPVTHKPLTNEQVQEKYKEAEQLIEEKPYLLYQHPTDRAIQAEIEQMKFKNLPISNIDYEHNQPSTSSQYPARDENRQQNEYFAEDRASFGRGSKVEETPNRRGESLPPDRYSDQNKAEISTKQEKRLNGNENSMRNATPEENSKKYLIESLNTSSTEVQSDVRYSAEKPPPTETYMKRSCACEGIQDSRKQYKPESRTDTRRRSDASKYDQQKNNADYELVMPDDFPSCYCEGNKAKFKENRDDNTKSRLMQRQGSPNKEKVDAATQVIARQSGIRQFTENKQGNRHSSISFNNKPIGLPGNMPQYFPQVVPPQCLPYCTKFNPNASFTQTLHPDRQSYNISSQYGPDRSSWTLASPGAPPEWKILAPANIMQSSQFRSALPVTNNNQYFVKNARTLPQMVNHNQLTPSKMLNSPYFQKPPSQQPCIGCCASKLSISSSGIAYHHRSASCSVNGLQSNSCRNLSSSLSFGGLPMAGIPRIGMPQTGMESSIVPRVDMPANRMDPAMPGHMVGPTENNSMFPFHNPLQMPMDQMPYSFFPWAHEQPQKILNSYKQEPVDGMGIPLNALPPYGGATQQDFAPQNRTGPGSYMQTNLQQEQNNQTSFLPQGRDVYQPENYYPPQRSFSTSASPYFATGYSPSRSEFECINRSKCRDPGCGQKMRQSPTPVPSNTFYDPYNIAMNSQPTGPALNNFSTFSHNTQPGEMVSHGSTKSCITLNDKSILCSALGPIRMCARDAQAGIPCATKTSSVPDAYDTRSAHGRQPTVESVLESIMQNVACKASRAGKEHGSCLPCTIRELDGEHRRSSTRRSPSRGRHSATRRGSNMPKRSRGSSQHGTERRRSGRRHGRLQQSALRKSANDKRKSPRGGSRSRATSPAHGNRSADHSHTSIRTHPTRSRTSRSTSPGLQDRHKGKTKTHTGHGGRKPHHDQHHHPRRTSRGTSPGLESESFIGELQSPSMRIEITGTQVTKPGKNEDKCPSFNSQTSTCLVKSEAKALKQCTGPCAHEPQPSQVDDRTSYESTNLPKKTSFSKEHSTQNSRESTTTPMQYNAPAQPQPRNGTDESRPVIPPCVPGCKAKPNESDNLPCPFSQSTNVQRRTTRGEESEKM